MATPRNVRSKLSCMPSVRAYQHEGLMVLKYYDDGQSGAVHCPHCSWSGSVDEYSATERQGFAEMKCPDCDARLGTLTVQVGASDTHGAH